ncbi:uncharacterized protein CTRU02_215501 [Colletotrichum truncatum]|uniref:Uncharacterized protein n=1 Tax=Colletotrichum truncatum TaxID=5467 RepID=A0ACC3YCM8_COLTU|nr:uncharacterized protein CTRU02_05553 [Colletotrichum truncatum]KAF6793996.1 hypothetical protein CTRU02_05553 [Colletotrichum truncatum]
MAACHKVRNEGESLLRRALENARRLSQQLALSTPRLVAPRSQRQTLEAFPLSITDTCVWSRTHPNLPSNVFPRRKNEKAMD